MIVYEVYKFVMNKPVILVSPINIRRRFEYDGPNRTIEDVRNQYNKGGQLGYFMFEIFGPYRLTTKGIKIPSRINYIMWSNQDKCEITNKRELIGKIALPGFRNLTDLAPLIEP